MTAYRIRPAVAADAAIILRFIRELADFLERHPEALIQGKGGPRK